LHAFSDSKKQPEEINLRSKLQNKETPLGSKSNQKYIDGIKGRPAKKCYILNKRLRFKGWKVQGKYVNGVLETLKADKTLKKRYGIDYKKLTANNTEEMEPVKGVAVNFRPTPMSRFEVNLGTENNQWKCAIEKV